MNKKIIKQEGSFKGQSIKLEIGKLAEQADAAVLTTVGETTVLVTVVSQPTVEITDGLPLKIDYEERFYAGGKLGGSRYTRREGRPNDGAIVNGRLIDHAIRPLFPKDYADDTQIVITVLSIDGVNDPLFAGFLGVTSALGISGIPFKGPILPLRISKVNGETRYDLSEGHPESAMDLVVSYLENGSKVQALEAHAHIIPEAEVVAAIKQGGEEVKPLFDLVNEFISKLNVPIRKYEKNWLSKDAIAEFKEVTFAKIDEMLANGLTYKDREWNRTLNGIAKEVGPKYEDKFSEKQIGIIINEVQKDWVRNVVMVKNSRIDGRPDNQIRELSAEVAVLPQVHGSGLFSRGLTQALSIVTLSSASEKHYTQSMYGESKKGYMHHYNFPPYSTGEVGRVGNTNRREIGHGMLAEKALIAVLPDEKDFPYTIRVVSEILSSNGSTSMASTCGSSLALMDAGVPIKSHVAGIGVGLFVDKDKENLSLEDYKLLTDIMGIEDFAGYMDFKLTGTREGMTAIQLELKLQGLPLGIFDKLFEVSRTARMQVLDVMESVISTPRAELGKTVPRIVTIMIEKDQIGMIIGSGGATIRGIMEATGAQVDVDEVPEGGVVSIMSNDPEKLAAAVDMVERMTIEIEVGETYEGVVTRIEPYGAFIELAPKQEGLLHVSEYSYDFINDISEYVNLGDKITTKVKSLDNGKISLSRKALLEKPEGYVEPEPRPSFDRGGGNRFGGSRRDNGGRGGFSRGGGRSRY